MYTTRFDAVKKVWSGDQIEFEIDKNQNFGEIILEKLADVDSERVMQIDGDTGETLTKAEIRRLTIRCARNLMKQGCTQNQRIAIVARNHHNLTPLLFASFCIGSAVCPLDVLTIGDGISHILRRIEPTFIFCDADVLLSIKKMSSDIGFNPKLFTVKGNVDGFDSIDSLMTGTDTDSSSVCAKIENTFSHVALIACSSGSTGMPKSICMSHALLIYTFCMRIDELAFVILCFSSLYWFSGVWVLVSSAFKNTRVFSSKPFSTKLFFDIVEQQKVESFAGPPYQIQAFLKSEQCEIINLKSLLACILIGGYVPSVLLQTLKKVIPNCIFVTTYGMTEIGGSASMTLPYELEEHPNSVGCLVPGVQMKIINDKNEKCGIFQEGEIYIKTSIPALGYYRDATANQNAFDVDGYYITGDIGYFDDSGRLYISGRKKDTFKNRGFAIWPKEIEDIIVKNPAVHDACVVSVYDREIMSDLPAAVVVKKKQYKITESEIYALIANQLASYKRLDGGVYFVDSLPMTPSDKVMRSKVEQLAQHLYQTKKLQKQSKL